MDWIQVIIHTTTEGIEPVSGRLYQAGITGIEIEDAADFNDFLENNQQYWDYVDDSLLYKKTAPTVVKVYISDNESGRDMLMAVKSELAALKSLDNEGVFGSLELELNNMNEQDWANNWKKYYKPLTVGDKILIKPEWEEIDDAEGRIVFNINPGMSFGTGTHQSTQLCIESLEKHIKKGDGILDLGCGSGILSIIAMLLEADHALAVDIDPNAAKIALENAEKNDIDSSKYKTLAGNIITDEELQKTVGAEKYDIVLANIVADVIIAIAPFCKTLLKPDGVFITSGIIKDRKDDVKAALEENGFNITDINEKGEWVSITAI